MDNGWGAKVWTGFLWGLTIILTAMPAHAYIDPGAGSYFLQLLLAGLLGGAFVIKASWKRFTSLISRLLRRSPTLTPHETNQEKKP
ncbi:MAG: hypothetical protein QXP27_09420 [Candidatus Methanomethyliaceae archaeon]